MTNKQWFNDITKHRTGLSKVLEDDTIKAVKDLITNKYSEKAHFIYELIQNADDAKATRISFKLKEDGLEFIHNGTERFTLSNPESKIEDKENDAFGHINAITSIALSTKTKSDKIGKFGIGFKSVFRYTNTPHIYDEIYQFKIQDYIIPIQLSKGVKPQKNKTIFWFPFDKEEIKPKQAYKEILNKFKNLRETLLFLNHVNRMSWGSIRDKGEQVFKLNSSIKYNNIKVDYITSKIEINKNIEISFYYKFSKQVPRKKELFDSVIFNYDKQKKEITPKKANAYCFFETKHITNLNFIINAPFELNDNREQLMYSDEQDDWNVKRLNSLAKLTTESINILSTKIKEVKIDHTILNIVPLSPIDQNTGSLPFSMFYDEILLGFKTNKILNTSDGKNIDNKTAYWSEDKELIKLFPDNLLSEVLKKDTASFVFSKLLDTKEDDSNKRKYVREIVDKQITAKDLLKNISIVFTEKRDDKWLLQLYKYLQKKDIPKLTNTIPVFINQSGKAKSIFDKNGNIQLYLPEENSNKTTSINERLTQSQTNIRLFEKLGFKLPNLFDEVSRKIIPYYKTGVIPGKTKLPSDFKNIFKCYLNSDGIKRSKLIAELKDLSFLAIESKGSLILKRPNEINMKTLDLEDYFNKTKAVFFYLDINRYKNIISVELEKELLLFFDDLGVNSLPKIIFRQISKPVKGRLKKLGFIEPVTKITVNSKQEYIDKEILGAQQVLKEIKKNHKLEKSLTLWKVLLNLVTYKLNFNNEIRAIHHYKYRNKSAKSYFTSQIIYDLINTKWLKSYSGEWMKPKDLSISQLDNNYSVDKNCDATKNLKDILQLADWGIDKVDSKPIHEKNPLTTTCRDEEELRDVEEFKRKRREQKDDIEFVPISGINSDTMIMYEVDDFENNDSKSIKINKATIRDNKSTQQVISHKRNYKYLRDLEKHVFQRVENNLNKKFSSKKYEIINHNDKNQNGDVGYDFEVLLNGKSELYIQVKLTEEVKTNKLKLTAIQWRLAKDLHTKGEGAKLYIYYVRNANTEMESIIRIPNPYKLFSDEKLIVHKIELLLN